MSPIADAVAVGPKFMRDDLPIADLRPSPLNPRKHFDQARLDELAASIASVGLIEPLVARPVNGHYEIVAGERRFRAAQQAGLRSLPVVVKPLTDAQALEIMVIENNQRDDVNALEEGDGFARLLTSGYALDTLAERLGRSKKYVYDRVKLLDLAPKAKALLLAGKMTAGHAILLARLKPAQQEQAISATDGGLFAYEHGQPGDYALVVADARDPYEDVKPVSVRELQRYIAWQFRFDVDHAAKAAPLEFGDTVAAVAALRDAGRPGRKIVEITLSNNRQPATQEGGGHTYMPEQWRYADGKPHRERFTGKSTLAPMCEHAVLGVVASGEGYGRAFDVCVERNRCTVHWASEIKARSTRERERVKGAATSLSSSKTGSGDTRQDLTVDAHRAKETRDRERRDKALERAIGQAADRVTALTPAHLRLVLVQLLNADMDHDAFNARFGTHAAWGCGAKAIHSLAGRRLLQAVVFAALSGEYASLGDLDGTLSALGVSVADIEKTLRTEEAAAAKTTPVQTSALNTSTAKKNKKSTAKKNKKR